MNALAHTTGIIGDIHLDLGALRATLAGPLAGCDRLICAGDFLDRGPDDPEEVLDELLSQGVELIVGNHELAYLGGPCFDGMIEDRCIPLATDLRELVLDGMLVAAAAVGDLLVVHGGVSRAFWKRYLRGQHGDDVTTIAGDLNRGLLRAVTRQDFTAPQFGALRHRIRGPFWAHLAEDLLGSAGMPPIRQVVGHVIVATPGWRHGKDGSVFPLAWNDAVAPGILGYLIKELPSDRPL